MENEEFGVFIFGPLLGARPYDLVVVQMSVYLSVYQTVSLGFPAFLYSVGRHNDLKVTASFFEKIFPPSFVVKGSNRPQNEAFRVLL